MSMTYDRRSTTASSSETQTKEAVGILKTFQKDAGRLADQLQAIAKLNKLANQVQVDEEVKKGLLSFTREAHTVLSQVRDLGNDAAYRIRALEQK